MARKRVTRSAADRKREGAELRPRRAVSRSGGRGTVIPVVEEVPAVGKRTVQTGRVRIDKRVAEHEVVVDEPLLRDDVHIERIAVGRDIPADEDPPRIRYEGDTMIVPVLEEVPVVTKKLLLTEELRITRTKREIRNPRTVTVRVESVSVERDKDASTDAKPGEEDSRSSR